MSVLARIRRKQGRQSAPSKTTTAIAVRVPNALLKDVRRVAGGAVVQKSGHSVHYPDQSPAALKASILAALSSHVESRIAQNRSFVAGLDELGRDRERGLDLCVERLTEGDPPYARRQAPARPVELEETLLVCCWPRRPVGRLEDVPQASGKVPTDPPVQFRLTNPHRLVCCWPRRPVGRLEDVPQASGKVPTDPPVQFKESSPSSGLARLRLRPTSV